jgi:O-glycosyl hydrolase
LIDRLDVSQEVRVTDGRLKTSLPARSAAVFTVR